MGRQAAHRDWRGGSLVGDVYYSMLLCYCWSDRRNERVLQDLLPTDSYCTESRMRLSSGLSGCLYLLWALGVWLSVLLLVHVMLLERETERREQS